jgi:hypothetical protein
MPPSPDGARDVAGDAHDHLVACARLGEPGTQGVPIIVPPPDDFRLAVHLRDRAARTCLGLRLAHGELLPMPAARSPGRVRLNTRCGQELEITAACVDSGFHQSIVQQFCKRADAPDGGARALPDQGRRRYTGVANRHWQSLFGRSGRRGDRINPFREKLLHLANYSTEPNRPI